MTTFLNQEALLKLIPHRYENVLLDSVTVTAEDEGVLELTISPDDVQGRHLFLDQVKPDTWELARPVALEILALSAIAASGGIEDTQMLFYAGISSVEFIGDIQAGISMTGEVKKTGKKKLFYQYEGSMSQNGKLIAKAQFTAFVTEKSEFTIPARSASPSSDPIRSSSSRRSASMSFLKNLITTDESHCTAQFTYPATHPLNRGHFDNFPVMMGVMQIMVLEEAATLFLEQQDLSPGVHTLSAKGQLLLESSQEAACDCRGLTFIYDNQLDNLGPFAKLSGLKKASFKQMILPEDSVHVILDKLVIS